MNNTVVETIVRADQMTNNHVYRLVTTITFLSVTVHPQSGCGYDFRILEHTRKGMTYATPETGWD